MRGARRSLTLLALLAFSSAVLTAVGPGTSAQVPVPVPEGGIPGTVQVAGEVLAEISGGALTLRDAALPGKLSYASRQPPAPGHRKPGLAPPSDNVLVNDPFADTTNQDTQSETSLTLAGSNVVVGFNDSGHCFDPCPIVPGHFTGRALSTDGGATFQDLGTLPDDPNGDLGDPVLATDQNSGTVYFSTLGGNLAANFLQTFRSFDGGQTFVAPVNTTPGEIGFQDKEWLAVDNATGPGQGNVYVSWTLFPGGIVAPSPVIEIRVTRSTNGGATFVPPPGTLVMQGCGQGSYVAVGPAHEVYVFWWDCNLTPRRIMMRKSTDQGVSFGPPVTVATLLGTGTNGRLPLNGGFRSNSFPHVAVNPVSGNLYAVFNDNPAGDDRGDIYLTQSTDGGLTWSSPARVNDDATIMDQFMPTVGVTADGSHLMIGWYDRRRNVSGNDAIDRFGVIGRIAGGTVTFGSNFSVSDGPFPVVREQDPIINIEYMGDYDQTVGDAASFFSVWSDNRLGSKAHEFQPDVRFAKTPETATADLVAEVRDKPSSIHAGRDLTYTIEVTNLGPDAASGVTVRDDLPSSVLKKSATSTQGVCDGVGTVVCSLGRMAKGAIARVTIVAVPTQAGNITNSASVTSAAQDPAPDNNSDSVTTKVQGNLATVEASHSSGNIAVPIPQEGLVDVPLAVSQAGRISDLNFKVRLNHTFDRDVELYLIHPDGSKIELSADNGGGGDNYGAGPQSCGGTFTVLDDSATLAGSPRYISPDGAAPFAGTFRPEQSLARFQGKAASGTWTLRIIDDEPPDAGTLFCWQLEVTTRN
jgi:uncharacterized repeat protein (TIGR01451 family)